MAPLQLLQSFFFKFRTLSLTHIFITTTIYAVAKSQDATNVKQKTKKKKHK